MYNHFTITVMTALNSSMIGSGWLPATFDWSRPVAQNDFGHYCKDRYLVAVLIGKWFQGTGHKITFHGSWNLLVKWHCTTEPPFGTTSMLRQPHGYDHFSAVPKLYFHWLVVPKIRQPHN